MTGSVSRRGGIAGFGAFTLVMVAVFAGLGIWQLQRRVEKHVLIAALTERLTARSCWARSCIVFCTKPALTTTIAPSGSRAGKNAQVPGPETSSRTAEPEL